MARENSKKYHPVLLLSSFDNESTLSTVYYYFTHLHASVQDVYLGRRTLSLSCKIFLLFPKTHYPPPATPSPSPPTQGHMPHCRLAIILSVEGRSLRKGTFPVPLMYVVLTSCFLSLFSYISSSFSSSPFFSLPHFPMGCLRTRTHIRAHARTHMQTHIYLGFFDRCY